MAVLQSRISDEQYAAIVAFAEAHQLRMSDLIRDAVVYYMSHPMVSIAARAVVRDDKAQRLDKARAALEAATVRSILPETHGAPTFGEQGAGWTDNLSLD